MNKKKKLLDCLVCKSVANQPVLVPVKNIIEVWPPNPKDKENDEYLVWYAGNDGAEKKATCKTAVIAQALRVYR